MLSMVVRLLVVGVIMVLLFSLDSGVVAGMLWALWPVSGLVGLPVCGGLAGVCVWCG